MKIVKYLNETSESEDYQHFPNNEPEKRAKNPTITKLKRNFGICVRLLTIFCIWFFGREIIEPSSIGDTPFSQLTLNSIFNSAMSVGLPIVCVFWAFNAPDSHEEMEPEEDPYIFLWASFGYFVICGLIAWIIWGEQVMQAWKNH